MTKEEVKSIRNQLGLSQEAFAQRLGISHNTVSRWEQGSRKPGWAAKVILRQIEEEIESKARST